MLKIEKKKKDEKHWADWGKEKNLISKRARDGERSSFKVRRPSSSLNEIDIFESFWNFASYLRGVFDAWKQKIWSFYPNSFSSQTFKILFLPNYNFRKAAIWKVAWVSRSSTPRNLFNWIKKLLFSCFNPFPRSILLYFDWIVLHGVVRLCYKFSKCAFA